MGNIESLKLRAKDMQEKMRNLQEATSEEEKGKLWEELRSERQKLEGDLERETIYKNTRDALEHLKQEVDI